MATSFLEVPLDHGFGINNLPYGVFSTPSNPKKRICVAIGDFVLDLHGIAGWFNGPKMGAIAHEIFGKETLNDFIALTPDHWSETRKYIKKILSQEEPYLQKIPELKANVLISREGIIMHKPIDIGDYTDFYASIDHARNIGAMFRGPENALMPNYLHMPIAYHGRASSVVSSGTLIIRPSGQILPVGASDPIFSGSKALDFELEMGCVIGGASNKLGEPIRMADVQKRLFGMVILNDWSARDIQKWEYQPLGPFLSKSFASTLSPWIVPMEALEPFLVPNREQEKDVLPYLKHDDNYNFDINLEVHLHAHECSSPCIVSRSNFKYLYWTLKQMLCHHSINGCIMKPGDLIGTGTISGPTSDSLGSMLEITLNGKKPLKIDDSTTRVYLEDEDLVIIKAFSVNKETGEKVSFGECEGRVKANQVKTQRPSIKC